MKEGVLLGDHETGAVSQHKNTVGITYPGNGDGGDYGLEATGARTLASFGWIVLSAI